MSDTPTKNIHQRLNLAMEDNAYLRKDSQVNAGAGGRYKAVSHDAVVGKTRSSFIKHGITVYPVQEGFGDITHGQTNSGKGKILFKALYNVHFVNIDNPDDRVVVPVEAHSEDMGDKAPGKAISYAVKTAILKTLLIETGEDEEQRVEEGTYQQQAQPAQQQRPADDLGQVAKSLKSSLEKCTTPEEVNVWREKQRENISKFTGERRKKLEDMIAQQMAKTDTIPW